MNFPKVILATKHVRICVYAIGAFLSTSASAIEVVPKYPPLKSTIPAVGSFERYSTRDTYGREITFYLSKSVGEPLPLALFVQGSGGQSHFQKTPEGISSGLAGVFLERFEKSHRVVIVEKVGIEFCYEPPMFGAAEGCPQRFLEEHTLDRWVEANHAAISASSKVSGVRAGGVLAVGHSEGGIVVARLSNKNQAVTAVASLAGGGANQLEDLRAMFGPGVNQMWREIQKDPNSISKFALGHPYRRWSSFLQTSTVAELLRSKASIFLAQGTADKNVPMNGFNFAVQMLRNTKRNRTAQSYSGADHLFRHPAHQGSLEGFIYVLDQVRDWAIADSVPPLKPF